MCMGDWENGIGFDMLDMYYIPILQSGNLNA